MFLAPMNRRTFPLVVHLSECFARLFIKAMFAAGGRELSPAPFEAVIEQY
jgi:hypothetical protein